VFIIAVVYFGTDSVRTAVLSTQKVKQNIKTKMLRFYKLMTVKLGLRETVQTAVITFARSVHECTRLHRIKRYIEETKADTVIGRTNNLQRKIVHTI